MADSVCSTWAWRWRARRAYCCSTNRWPGLLPRSASALRRSVKRISSDLPVLLVEHDIDRVFALADRVTVMNDGKVCLKATRPMHVRARRCARSISVPAPPRSPRLLGQCRAGRSAGTAHA